MIHPKKSAARINLFCNTFVEDPLSRSSKQKRVLSVFTSRQFVKAVQLYYLSLLRLRMSGTSLIFSGC